MIKLFKYIKTTWKLKHRKLVFETALLEKLYDFTAGFPDIVELAKRAKDLDMNELQKLIAVELVTYMKANEPSVEKDEADEDASAKAKLPETDTSAPTEA